MNLINLGIVGLGRMGFTHALNIIKNHNAKLISICVLNDEPSNNAVKKLKEEFKIEFNVYYEYNEMLEKEKLDGVVICSSTAFHPIQIKEAIKKEIHTFTEKPIGIDPETAIELKKDIKDYLDKTILRIGYMRRYDPSYQRAKQLVDSGHIGRPFLVRSYGQDPIKKIDGILKFGPSSGGEFIDMSAHDINIARWFLGTEPEEIWAIGDCYEFDEFKNWNDADNATALIKMKPDKDGKQAMVFILAGRTAAHGYNVETEIIGTKGALRIATVPRKDLLEIMDERGVVIECSQDFPERFSQAYLEEMNSFIQEVYDIKNNLYDWNKEPIVSIDDGINDLVACYKAKESFETKQLIKIDWKKELN